MNWGPLFSLCRSSMVLHGTWQNKFAAMLKMGKGWPLLPGIMYLIHREARLRFWFEANQICRVQVKHVRCY